MKWCVVIAFSDGELRRYAVDAENVFDAAKNAEAQVSKHYDLDEIVGVQIDRLDYPYFV